MPEYNGPGKLLWHASLCKAVRPDFSMVVFDRTQRHLATFNLRIVYVVDLDDPVRGKVQLQVGKSLHPAARTFTQLAWCKSDDTPELLAAVLGTDVLIFNTKTQKLVSQIPTPHGRSLHTPPTIEWGGIPCSLVTAGSDDIHRGSLRLWKVAASGAASPLLDSVCLKSPPQCIVLHPTKSFLAIHDKSVVQVWCVKTLEKILERDFLTPIRSVAWSVTKQSHLLVLYHRDGERRVNAPVLAELDMHNDSYMEEPAYTHKPHPLAGIATVKLNTLPIPFAPKLLLVAYSSNRCEDTFLRKETAEGVPPEYVAQTPFSPSQGIRAVGVRRVDGEKERALHLIILYSSGLLVARAFETKPIDILLDKQIRLLQERRDVEVVKIQSAGSVLESIKLRVKVPAHQVPFLEQTHHNSKNPAVVFFEVTVKQGDQMPEVTVSNNCIRNEHELSLEDGLLDAIALPMREAILGAVRRNTPWLPSMVDACNEQLTGMGAFQPSQLKKMPSPQGLRAQTFPRQIARTSYDGTPVHKGSHRSVSSIDTDMGRATHATPPSSLGDCPFLPVQSSPQICYKRAYVVQPRYCAAVFSPDGSLVCYGYDRDIYPKVRVLHGVGTEECHQPWRLTANPIDCAHNASISTCEKEKAIWLTLRAIVSMPPNKSLPLVKIVESILHSLMKAKRCHLFGAVAVVCMAHCRGEDPSAAAPAIFHPVKKSQFIESANYFYPAVKSASSPVLSVPLSQTPTQTDRELDTCAVPYDLRAAAYSAITILMNTAAAKGDTTQENEAASGLWLLQKRLCLNVPNNLSLPICTANPHRPDPDITLGCSICKGIMRGLAVACMKCGHVSHIKCQREWFAIETSCPLGCPCSCTFTM